MQAVGLGLPCMLVAANRASWPQTNCTELEHLDSPLSRRCLAETLWLRAASPSGCHAPTVLLLPESKACQRWWLQHKHRILILLLFTELLSSYAVDGLQSTPYPSFLHAMTHQPDMQLAITASSPSIRIQTDQPSRSWIVIFRHT